jgi:hypothetical protein
MIGRIAPLSRLTDVLLAKAIMQAKLYRRNRLA